MEKTVKPRAAFFEFTSCEGCQLTVLNCEDLILPLLGKIEIVNFREAMSEPRSDRYDIAFVEGSITRQSEIPRIKKIREIASCVVALGACAHTGCVNIIKNDISENENRRKVYGDAGLFSDTIPAKPVSDYVAVDFVLPGCPIRKDEFVRLVQCLLRGDKFTLPDHAVCVECRLLENGCLLLAGEPCMGPVSMSGCQAVCPSYGSVCWGCRGTFADANFEGHVYSMEDKKIDKNTIRRSYRIFNRIPARAAI